MNANDVKNKLIEVLQEVQALSGEDCPDLDGDTKPTEELREFTSKIFPTATGLLGEAIGEDIPCEENIFIDDETRQPLTINQTAELVCKILADEKEKEKSL
ncbi:hypothetical protein A8B75_09810 [Sphingomonadales bacterium EhC05]|nr:hypothetical protein A8B75_09810 [Sphingomonadales bacterium EhC05]